MTQRRFEDIPEVLRLRPQWVCSRMPDKVPVTPSGASASSTNSSTWSSFDTCRQAAAEKGWGVAFIFTEADPFAVIDLDHVRNADTGETEPWAQAIIDDLASYTEVSWSGTGWHIIVEGKLTGPGKKRGRVEVYDRKKVMTLTGDTVLGFGSEVVEKRDLTGFQARLIEGKLDPDSKPGPNTPNTPSSGDESKDEFALACKVARQFSCDFEKTKAEFLRQAPSRPKLQRADYVDRTIKNAIARVLTSQPLVEKPATSATPPPAQERHWRDVFHTGSELDNTPGKVFIKGILEEGITFFGAHSGVGKTWIGLSIAHALLSQQALFGVFPVLQRTNVLYLVPEMGGRKFRERLQRMRISMDGGFFCQTVQDGACDLEDPLLLGAVAATRAVVILDTAIRFQAGDEQSSTQQAQGLGAKMFKLINAGAQAVICMHHRKKDLGDLTPTLANTLRGTGDFGAMADCVWCVEHARKKVKGGRYDDDYEEESRQLTRLTMTCVKPRDMEPADPFTIQGRPYINDKGDFVVIDSVAEPVQEPISKDGDEKVLALVKAEPSIGVISIRRKTGFGESRVLRILNDNGWIKENGLWVSQSQPIPPTALPLEGGSGGMGHPEDANGMGGMAF